MHLLVRFIELFGSKEILVFPHHVHDLWPLDGDEVDAGLVGDGLGQQRLAASRRAAQQHTGRGVHACVEIRLKIA